MPGAPSDMLPRVAEDGRQPMQVYAAGFDRSSRRARVGFLLAGIGLNEDDSSRGDPRPAGWRHPRRLPYATKLPKLLAAARLAQHEYLLSIPMEPQGFPANDPGPRALMTSLSSAENLDRLRWLLAHVEGYAGVDQRARRHARRTAGRHRRANGPDPGRVRPPRLALRRCAAGGIGWLAIQRHVWSRDVDLVVDEPIDDIDVKLAQLEQIAHDKGDALGLAGAPSPVVVQHIAAWASGLLDRGLVLAPVSALARPPSDVAVSTQ